MNYLLEYFFKKVESTHIQKLRTDKNNFEIQLKTLLRKYVREHETEIGYRGAYANIASVMLNTNLHSNSPMEDFINTLKITSDPNYFFIYCYILSRFTPYFTSCLFKKINSLNLNSSNKFCKSTINGYSPLGSVLITGGGMRIDVKRKIISELRTIYGFKPTKKDLELASIVLFDSISATLKKMLIFMLCDIDFLVKDIRKQIIIQIINLFIIL